MLLAEKTILLRQRQMHARALHGGQGLDGARQLTFEPALEIQPLLELRHPETVAFHQLKAGHRALGQPLRRQAQAYIVHAIRRHHDRAAALGMAIGHVHLRKLGNDGTTVLVGQIGEQDAVVLLTPHHHGGDGSGHQQHHAQPQAQALGAVEC